MFADGIRAFVSVRDNGNGRYTYSIGRMSALVPFMVPAILNALNKREGTTEDCWGGSDTIGGSPRVAGSRLTPAEVAEVVESCQKPGSNSLTVAIAGCETFPAV
jgi:hypothetical protein